MVNSSYNQKSSQFHSMASSPPWKVPLFPNGLKSTYSLQKRQCGSCVIVRDQSGMSTIKNKIQKCVQFNLVSFVIIYSLLELSV
jgi:hypothetical protein